MVATNSPATEQTWYSNLGATHHITPDMANLSIHSAYQGGDAVQVGNGQGLSINHIGSSILHASNYSFHLRNLLHCPTASTNLLLMHQFSKDNSCYFYFDPNGFVVKDKISGRILFQGPIEHGLYPFRLTSNHVNKAGPAVLLGERVSAPIWHSRLGHPSNATLHLVLSKFALSRFGAATINTVCESCQLGKSKKLPFSPSTSVTVRPLKLIHCDVWGPAPISSMSGFRFYVIFIDDFSRYCWIYPLYHKSDVFVSFKAKVENLLENKIKILRSDGGGEFTSHQFEKFLSSCGITHQILCPHTPEHFWDG